MLRSDRLFGLVVVVVALAFIAGALQVRSSFMADPVGSRTFPIIIGAVAAICGVVMIAQPDGEPGWPPLRTLLVLGVGVAAMIGYAYSLRPFGFLIPTAVTAAVLSFMIAPRPVPAIVSGLGLSVGLFVLFRYALGLGLVPFPKGLLG